MFALITGELRLEYLCVGGGSGAFGMSSSVGWVKVGAQALTWKDVFSKPQTLSAKKSIVME